MPSSVWGLLLSCRIHTDCLRSPAQYHLNGPKSNAVERRAQFPQLPRSLLRLLVLGLEARNPPGTATTNSSLAHLLSSFLIRAVRRVRQDRISRSPCPSHCLALFPHLPSGEPLRDANLPTSRLPDRVLAEVPRINTYKFPRLASIEPVDADPPLSNL
jgi:hypothetical protein